MFRCGFHRALAALAVVFAAGLLAPEAQARFIQVAKAESLGGYTRYNASVTIWYETSSRKGFVYHNRRFHDGTNLHMTGQVPGRDVIAFWWDLHRSDIRSQAEVRNSFLNVDLPDTRVTYLGRYQQRIRSDLQAFSLPQVSADMRQALDRIWAIASQVAEADLFTYEASGGLAAYHERTVITQEGQIRVERGSLYQNPQQIVATGGLAPAEVNALKALTTGWWGYPDAFDWRPGMVVSDGIRYSATYSIWGYSKTVASKTLAEEEPGYTAVIAKINGFANDTVQAQSNTP